MTNNLNRLFAWLTIMPIVVVIITELNKSVMIWHFRVVDLVDLILLAPFYLWILLRIHFTLGLSERVVGASCVLIACFLYGHAMHVTANSINTYITEVHQYREQVPGDAYDLIYFLDEDLSHLILFGSFFALLTIWSLNDSSLTSRNLSIQMIGLGMVQGIAQGIAMIEASKPLLPFVIAGTILIMLFIVSPIKSGIVRFYMISTAIFMILTPLGYWIVLGDLEQPSRLTFLLVDKM